MFYERIRKLFAGAGSDFFDESTRKTARAVVPGVTAGYEILRFAVPAGANKMVLITGHVAAATSDQTQPTMRKFMAAAARASNGDLQDPTSNEMTPPTGNPSIGVEGLVVDGDEVVITVHNDMKQPADVRLVAQFVVIDSDEDIAPVTP